MCSLVLIPNESGEWLSKSPKVSFLIRLHFSPYSNVRADVGSQFALFHTIRWRQNFRTSSLL